MKNILILSVLVLLLLPGTISGQQNSRQKISRTYVNEPIQNIISEFKSLYKCDFYYIDQQLEGIYITININDQTLESAISQIANQAHLKYYVNNSGGFVLYKSKPSTPSETQKKYTLSGTITDSSSKEKIPFVSVYIQGLQKGCISDSSGHYILTDLSEGNYIIKFSYIGYIPHELKINLNTDKKINISLTENIFELKELEITPGVYNISTDGHSSRVLTKKEILYSPNLVKDITRTFRALPGLANNDFSSKPRIRGGNSDENAYYLDNFEIPEPFHFEEFDGLYSIISTDYVNSIKVLPGGFPAKYADKLSGIIDIKTPEYIDNNKINLSVDFLNLALNIKRKLSDKTNMFLSMRRTYLDVLLANANDDIDIDPVCYDIWFKANHNINSTNKISVNFLYSADLAEANIKESFYNWIHLNVTKNNYYSWINWRNIKNEKLDFLTTIGYQKLSRHSVFTFHNSISPNNPDNRETDNLVLKNNSRYKITDNLHLEFGGESWFTKTVYKFSEIRYNQYESTVDNIIIDSIDVDALLHSNHTSLYLQNTYLISDLMTITGGLRFSYFSYLKKPVLITPRIAFSYTFNRHLNATICYGIYNQADNIAHIRIYEGQNEPSGYFRQSRHYLGSITYDYKKSEFLLNLYYKNNNKLPDDYKYDVYNRLGGAISILDKSFTSASGFSEGIETTYRYRYERNTFSISYIYAVNKIKNLAGDMAYRDNDRRHTFILNNLFNLKNNWSIGIYFLFYTGEPYSSTTVTFVGESSNREKKVLFYNVGYKNSERLPNFSSFDMKVDKVFHFKYWELNFYVNIINLFSHENIRNYYWHPYEIAPETITTKLYPEKYLSTIFISLGTGISF